MALSTNHLTARQLSNTSLGRGLGDWLCIDTTVFFPTFAGLSAGTEANVTWTLVRGATISLGITFHSRTAFSKPRPVSLTDTILWGYDIPGSRFFSFRPRDGRDTQLGVGLGGI